MTSLQRETNTLAQKLTEIRLSITHPNNVNKAFILLEGDSDIKLFRSLFLDSSTDTTKLDGKDMAINALVELNKEYSSKVVAIVDADFDHLEDVNYPNNLLITDYHDMEIQMIESQALIAVIDEFSSDKCRTILKSKIRDCIYNIAIEIGYIRWFNKKNSGNLRFRGLKFENFVQSTNCSIIFNDDDFLNELLKHSADFSINELRTGRQKLKNQSKNALQICNGHDLTKLIAIIFSKNNVNQDKIESALRIAYRLEDFKNTKLFKNLNTWCDHTIYKIFESHAINKKK